MEPDRVVVKLKLPKDKPKKPKPKTKLPFKFLERSEAQEQQDIIHMWKAIGGFVQVMSQPQKVLASEGTADLRLQHPAIERAIWWEVKKSGGNLTVAQFSFLDAEYLCQATVGVGTCEEFMQAVVRPLSADIAMGSRFLRDQQRITWDKRVRANGRKLLLEYGSRGFRRKQETLLEASVRAALQKKILKLLGEELNIPST